MKFQLTAPSKTFLLGEYLALNTGEALLVTTQPRFELSVELTSENIKSPFHPESPAGRLLDSESTHFKMDFTDPHMSCGGFGRSSAEFLFALFLKDFKKIINTHASTAWIPTYVMKMFRQATKSSSTKPSGADTLAQFTGGLVAMKLKQSEAQKLDWFDDLSFSLFHTGKKVPTHKHLAELPKLNTEELQVIYKSGLEALMSKNKDRFLQAISSYRSSLKAQGLELSATTDKLDKLLMFDEILAVKGCGALGADVVICFHSNTNTTLVREKAEALNLTWVSDSDEISEGFSFNILGSEK